MVHAAHCNQFQHVPGCTGGQQFHRGTTREGKTPGRKSRPERQSDRGEIEFSDSRCSVMRFIDGRLEVQAHKAVTDAVEAERIVQGLIDGCREKRRGQMCGKVGKGYVAPGVGVEFFVSKRTIKECLCNEVHIVRSASRNAHYTAVALVDQLWESAQKGIRRRPKKNDTKDIQLKWVHERYAALKIQRNKYRVKMTAFEYKNKSETPLIYDVLVTKKR